MPVISKIGRNSAEVRLLFALMYSFLLLGSATMIGPFIMMLSSSLSNEADISDYRFIPRYFRENPALLAHYLNDKYYRDLMTVKELYAYDLPRIDVKARTVQKMVKDLGLEEKLADPGNRKLVEEYDEFLSNHIPEKLYQAGFVLGGGQIGPMNARYQEWLEQRFQTIEACNRAYGEQYEYWAEITAPLERIGFRNWAPLYNQRYLDYLEFKEDLPAWMKIPFEGISKWMAHLKFMTDGDIAKLNALFGTQYTDFHEIPLPLIQPDQPELRNAWEQMVRRKWPLRLFQPTEEAVREYRAYLQYRRKSIEKLNEAYGSNYSRFDEIPWPEGRQFEGTRQSDFIEFLTNARADAPRLSLSNVTLLTASGAFRDWLLARHGGSLEGINAALGTQFKQVEDITIPHALWEWNSLVSKPDQWRWMFAKRNYFEVVSYILTKGRALINTVVFITLSIVITLTVNPLCAYALSRFNLSYAYKVLLFLLATMAFPAEVTLIPNFLLLRDLGFLNTFAALVLPGMANGFSIFILKGFFDTLPKELYEAAQLDGAGELRMFYQITMPLCKPVFAYIALVTFTGAYGAFLFALTVCQDPKMWTIMVWLYDLNASAPEHIRVAALVVAMVPTLIVFITCQRVIMRGIVLPQMQ